MLSTRAHWRIQQKILDEYYLEYIDSAYAGLTVTIWTFIKTFLTRWDTFNEDSSEYIQDNNTKKIIISENELYVWWLRSLALVLLQLHI